MGYPNGWLIRMKQYSKRSYDQFEQYEDQFRQMRGNVAHYTSFGNFDRIEFVPIERFSAYRDQIASDNQWFGKQQAIILYALENNQRRVFQMDTINSKQLLVEQTDNGVLQPLQCRFFIHTMLYISGTSKASINDYHTLLNLVKNKILQLVDMYNQAKENKKECLKCEVFGTFNSAEIAILWAADQFVDVLYLLDQMRYMRFVIGDAQEKNIFVSTHTVISANPEFQNESANPPKGFAMVQLQCSITYDKQKPEAFSLNNTTKFIKEVFEAAGLAFDDDIECSSKARGILFSCAGEYDYIAEVPFEALPKIFPYEPETGGHLEKNFSIHNKEFALHIRQTATRLAYLDANIDKKCKELKWQDILAIEANGNVACEEYDISHLNITRYISSGNGEAGTEGITYSVYQKLYTDMERLIPLSGLHKTLELLYRDYVEILCTAIDHLWVKDYHEQFMTVLYIMQSYLDLLDSTDSNEHLREDAIREFTTQFKQLYDILQQQVNHIAESSKLFFEAPNSKMGYTAQFDLILHAYYGIVKELIEQAYYIDKNSLQYNITPVINFTNTTIIESTMLRTADENWKYSRLISLEVPYDSWSNPLYYTPFLFHEIYHYITPVDRRERNSSFLVIILHQVGLERLHNAIEHFFETKAKEDDTGRYQQAIEKQYVWNICKMFSYPLLDAINGEREHLHELISLSDSSCTAYELRNAIEDWFSTSDSQEDQTKWFKKMAQTAAQKILEAKIKKTNNKSILFEAEVLCLEYAKSGLEESWSEFSDENTMSADMELALEMLWNLREIYPDVAMIQGTAMGVSEYLLQFAMLQSNLLNTPSAIEKWKMLALRLGPIVEFLLPNNRHLGDYKKEFIDLFVSFLHISKGNSDSEIAIQENTHLAVEWFDFFHKVFNYYISTFSIYRLELRSQILNQYTFQENPKRSIKRLYEKYWKLLHSFQTDKSVSQKIFWLNIQLIHLHQNQNSLIQLKKIWEKKEHGKTVIGEAFKSAYDGIEQEIKPARNTEFNLYNCDNLFEQLRKMLAQLKETHEKLFGKPCAPGEIWYRGIANNKFHILPSMFVNFSLNEKMIGGTLKNTPAQLLEHRFQQFKFRADGAPELYSQPSYQESDYLALMQHYHIPTNMLDWSEDIFASLYFALEEHVKDQNKQPDTADAAVYLFDPAAYNLARKNIIEQCIPKESSAVCNKRMCRMCRGKNSILDCSKCKIHRENYVRKSIYETGDLVPNVSIDLNRDIFDVLFLRNRRTDPYKVSYYTKGSLKGSPINCAPMCFNLPVAIYTSRLNPRIRAQSGQFMVFDPYTLPIVNPSMTDLKGCFDYIALDTLQKNWLSEDNNRRPFLLKLIIRASVKKSLGEQLRYMGIKTGKYYPELSNERFSF